MEIKLNVSELYKSLQNFGWIDYAVFILMLISCAAVGVYFGFIDKKRKRRLSQNVSKESEVAQEYLMGGRQMSVVPVALSIVAR